MKRLCFRKTDFFLRGVHVDIESVRFDIQKEHERRVMPFGKKRSIPLHDRMKHGRIADGTPVYKQFLWHSRGPRMDRIDHHATDRRSRCPASHLNSPIEKRLAVYLKYSITICCHGGIVENLLAVMGQAEVHRWPGEACKLHDMTDVRELGRGRFKKLLSGRLIEK
jgi:hypothetical protein